MISWNNHALLPKAYARTHWPNHAWGASERDLGEEFLHHRIVFLLGL